MVNLLKWEFGKGFSKMDTFKRTFPFLELVATWIVPSTYDSVCLTRVCRTDWQLRLCTLCLWENSLNVLFRASYQSQGIDTSSHRKSELCHGSFFLCELVAFVSFLAGVISLYFCQVSELTFQLLHGLRARRVPALSEAGWILGRTQNLGNQSLLVCLQITILGKKSS